MKINQCLLILFLPVSIILSNLLYLAYNSNFYKTIYIKENIYSNFQSKVVVDDVTKELIGYFRGQNNLEDKIFSYQAKIHLRDVKLLIRASLVLNYLSIFTIAITILFFQKRKKYKLLKRSIIIASSITLSVAILIAVSLTINFDYIFTIFHKIFFNNNLWLFDSSDNLVKLFPTSFFISFANKLFINILLTSFAIIAAAMLFIKNDKLSN